MAELKIQALEAALRLERIKKYGPKSDAVPSDQLELLEAELGVSDAEVAEEAQREPVAPIEQEKTGSGASRIPAGRRCQGICRAWNG